MTVLGQKGRTSGKYRRPALEREPAAFGRGRKPVSVFESAIYLRNLPPGIGRAVLICRYIWSCRPVAVPAACRHAPSWALTPRFHPYPKAVIFCYGRRRSLPSVLSTGGCPILSGLSSAHARRGRSSHRGAKVQIISKYFVSCSRLTIDGLIGRVEGYLLI